MTKKKNIPYCADRVDLTAGQEYVFYKSDMPGLDIDKLDLLFDFGGSSAGTTVDINNVVFKEHSCDEFVLSFRLIKPKMDWTYDPLKICGKLLMIANLQKILVFDASWSQIGDPTYSQDGDVHTITMPDQQQHNGRDRCTRHRPEGCDG